MLKVNQQFGIDIRNFTQEKKIGIGGFSDVYLAQYKKDGNNYAAKVIKSIVKEDEKKKIEDEIKIMSVMNHPTIIKYLGYSLLDFNLMPNIVIFTELIKNGSLSVMISMAKQSILPEDYDNTSRQIILIGIASGMRYLHQQGIIHCDLKTNNILLDENYYPHIIDFGMAKYANKNNENKIISGTLPYMAPEIILGHKYTYKIDVYAFAMIMYEVICESDLYPDLDYNHSMTKEFKEKVAISNKRPKLKLGIKGTLKYLIQRCCSPKDYERPSFDEIYDKLIDPHYYLENVDVKRVNEYVDFISKNDVFDNSKSDLIQKVRTLSKENEDLKRQNEQLKENNEKLSNDCIQMKNILDEMIKKIANDPKLINTPLKGEDLLNNSRFLQPKDKKENESLTKQLQQPQKDDTAATEPKENLNSAKKIVHSPKESQTKEKFNSPRRPIRFTQDDNNNNNNESLLRIPFAYQNKERINGQGPNLPLAKLPSLSKMKRNDPITFSEFNACSLHQQQQIVNNKVRSMGYRSRNQSLVDLQSLINSIIEFVDSPETPGYIEIQPAADGGKKQDDKLDNIDKSAHVSILFKTTEALYNHQLLKNDEFKELLDLFENNVSIEIKYRSKVYQSIYETISKMRNININVLISGINKTDNTFKGNKCIDLIRLDDSVVNIIDYAFKNCCSLTKVIIPSSVNSIGSGSFEGCESLKSISIPSSIKFIDFSVFKNCASLADVSLPNSIKMIKDSAFYGCSSLKKINLPPLVSSIGDFAFFGCSSLESVEIPFSTKSIGKCSFRKCSSLVNVSIPSSVNSIGKDSFEGCTSLERITIPSSIKNLNELNIKPNCNVIFI